MTAPAAPTPVAATPAQPLSHPPSEQLSLYGVSGRRIAPRDLQAAKEREERWAMLTSYDVLTAGVFDEAGIPVLLVGDSAANTVLGYATTVPVTVEELVPLARAVVRGSTRAMVVADLPFGSYQSGPSQALETAARFLKAAEVHGVKLEGGRRVVPQVEALVAAGVPVTGHVGLTPQSVHALGFRVQGRGEAGHELLDDAVALQEAGAFAVVLEAVPADLAERITKELTIPTIGIGAGAGCDAQVLVWQDMAGLTERTARFVKRFADLRGELARAASDFAAEVRTGAFPAGEHTYS